MNTADTSTLLETYFEQEAWLRRLARGLVRDDAAAQDLVQDTWAAALENPPRDTTRPRAWLSAVAKRLAAKRSQRCAPIQGGDLQLQVSDRMRPEMASLRFETSGRLRSCVERLEEPVRTTMLLRYQEELPQAAIAARMRVGERTVRNRVRAGLDAIRADLGRDLDGTELDGRSWAVVLAPLLPPAGLALPAPTPPARPPAAPRGLRPGLAAALVGATGLTIVAYLAIERAGGGPVAPAAGTGVLAGTGRTADLLAPGAGADLRSAASPGPAGPGQAPGRLAGARPAPSVAAVEPGPPESGQSNPGFTTTGWLRIDGEPATGFVASYDLLSKEEPQLLPDANVPLSSEGTFELKAYETGRYHVWLTPEVTQEQKQHGAWDGLPRFCTLREIEQDHVDDPLRIEVWTGQVRVLSAAQGYAAILLAFSEAHWAYHSDASLAVETVATFRQVPEGTIRVVGQPRVGEDLPADVELLIEIEVLPGMGYDYDVLTRELVAYPL